LASRCAVHLFETRLEGDILRKSIAAILAGLLSCSSVIAAEPALLLPSAVGVPKRTPVQRPLDCYLIGAGGAAMVGSWYGAGAGALIGWGVGRAK
jgi:hypothetical protein